jgi:hypothetical protein
MIIGKILKVASLIRAAAMATDSATLLRYADSVIYDAIIIEAADGGFFKKNHDYGDAWPKILDDYRSGEIKTIVDFIKKKKKSVKKKKASYVAPIDSYCGSKRNLDYWKSMFSEDSSDSINDFLDYVKSAPCGNGE